MSKRRNVKKPSYVLSDSDDDEDFILPAAKRSKSSQDSLIGTRGNAGDRARGNAGDRARGNVGDRALERDVERAKQLSLQEKKKKKVPCTRYSHKEEEKKEEKRRETGRSVKKCGSVTCSPDSSGSVNNVAKKQSKRILISSESDTEPSQLSAPKTGTKPSDGKRLHRGSLVPSYHSNQDTLVRSVSGAVNVPAPQQPLVTADKQGPYSDEEYGISPPASSEHSSSEPEFKLSQISSSSEKGLSSDEEFRLDSDDHEFSPEKKKPKVKPKAVAPPKTATPAASTKKHLRVATNVLPERCVTSTPSTEDTKPTLKSVGSRPSIRTLKPATSRPRTVNIPALLSSSQSPSGAAGSGPLGIKIGLSKHAKFKSLHANIKRS